MSSLNEGVSPILLWAWLEASQLGMISVALCTFPKVPENVILEPSTRGLSASMDPVPQNV